MKLHLVAAFIVALGAFSPLMVSAQAKPFYCGNYTKQDGSVAPATYAKLPSGAKIPMFVWSSNWSVNSGYNPRTRCEHVSERFNKSAANRSLGFMRTGMVNGLAVICTAPKKGGECPNQNVLITLKDGSTITDADRVLGQMLAIRRKVGDGGNPLQFASGSMLSYDDGYRYLNVDDYLKFLDQNMSSGSTK